MTRQFFFMIFVVKLARQSFYDFCDKIAQIEFASAGKNRIAAGLSHLAGGEILFVTLQNRLQVLYPIAYIVLYLISPQIQLNAKLQYRFTLSEANYCWLVLPILLMDTTSFLASIKIATFLVKYQRDYLNIHHIMVISVH